MQGQPWTGSYENPHSIEVFANAAKATNRPPPPASHAIHLGPHAPLLGIAALTPTYGGVTHASLG